MKNKTTEFYKKFKYCIPSNKEIAEKEESILENIINMSNKDLTAYIRQYIVKLTYYKKNFLDLETSELIAKILIEIGFILRIQYIDYLKNTENNTLNNNDEEIINLSKMIQLLVYEITTIISSKEYEIDNIFDNLDALKSDTTIGHINRIFITNIEAINFFNNKLNHGAASRLRIDFKKNYYKFSDRIYQRYHLINNANTLDSNVKLGVRKIENYTINDAAIGILIHDISLDKERDYIPLPNEEKDNHSIKDYAFAKYFMRGNEGAVLTVSLHHEYYSYGYGLFTELYKAALRRNPNHEIEYIISYDYKDILTLQSLTYLPAKILEVIDVYDTLTKSMNKNPKEAVLFMKENFLEKDIKIDPIITDSFIDYLKEIKKIKL
ncbi:hypothetical protein [uncultured Brachyspira sp.]|uniref:hypothetical protein n=1 Tax=uncultured Brachyspira sp. TaxID=221953 RepID=UPI00260AB293|nr:hypothetical protein [uncultured Brachyspira sp.]